MSFVAGVLASVSGNTLIGTGQAVQKWALNEIQESKTILGSSSTQRRPPFLSASSSSLTTTTTTTTAPLHATEISWTDRLYHPRWVLGIAMVYVGELCGNTVALSLTSPTVIAPLGIVAVFVNALLAQRWLRERITLTQWYGYAWIFMGVFALLVGAPKDQPTPISPASIYTIQTVVDWTVFLVHSWFFWYLFGALLMVTYIYEYRIRSESLASPSPWLMFYYVVAVALSASIAVLSAKVLTVFGRVVYAPVSSSVVYSSAEKEVPWTLESWSPTHTVLLMVLSFLVMSLVAQEVLRQKAIAQFPVSQFHPVTYAAFNAISILASALVFRELADDTWTYAVFVLTYVLGIGAILVGSRKLAFNADDDEPLRTKRQ